MLQFLQQGVVSPASNTQSRRRVLVGARNLLWRERCRSTVNSGNACLQPLLSNATMEGTVVFFVVRSGNDVIQQWRNRRRCFLCGLFPGYIARTSTVPSQLWLVKARDAIRVGCSSGCRVGSGVFGGREGTHLLWVIKCIHCKVCNWLVSQ
jgi:hypothetical protein